MRDYEAMASNLADQHRKTIQGPAVFVDFDDKNAMVKFNGFAEAPPAEKIAESDEAKTHEVVGASAPSTSPVEKKTIKLRHKKGTPKPKAIKDEDSCECTANSNVEH